MSWWWWWCSRALAIIPAFFCQKVNKWANSGTTTALHDEAAQRGAPAVASGHVPCGAHHLPDMKRHRGQLSTRQALSES
jgi:hypothetical protein